MFFKTRSETKCKTPIQSYTLLTLSEEEIEKRNDDRVSAEHVVTACAHSLDRHARAPPDDKGALELRDERRVWLQVICKGKNDNWETYIL